MLSLDRDEDVRSVRVLLRGHERAESAIRSDVSPSKRGLQGGVSRCQRAVEQITLCQSLDGS